MDNSSTTPVGFPMIASRPSDGLWEQDEMRLQEVMGLRCEFPLVRPPEAVALPSQPASPVFPFR